MDSLEDPMAFLATGDPEISPVSFVYEPLPRDHIRLLQIHDIRHDETDIVISCSMEPISLNALPFYFALSYTWGDPRPQMYRRADGRTGNRKILINGASKTIGANLHDALHHMRSLRFVPASAVSAMAQGPAYIWIDALSINQDDNSEKAIEVERMDQTYRNASAVVAWLGDSDEHTQGALEILKQLSRIPEADYDKHQSHPFDRLGRAVNDLKWTSFATFFCRAWFTRTWVIQEAVLAKDINMLVGSTIISSQDWRPAVRYLLKTKLWNRIGPALLPLSTPGTWNAEPPSLGTVVGALGGSIPLTTDFPLLPLMAGRGSAASDPRDCIYAMYGLARECLRRSSMTIDLPKVSYAPENRAQDVFIEWARLLINDGKAHYVLPAVEDRKRRRLPSLPSWVPDYSVTVVPNPLTLSHRGGIPWKAAGRRIFDKITCLEDSARLRMSAARFDYIVDVAHPFFDMHERDYWIEVLKFIQPLTESQEPYAIPLEAVGRTLTADDGRTAAGGWSPGRHFVDWAMTYGTAPLTRYAIPRNVVYNAFLAADPKGEVVPEFPALDGYIDLRHPTSHSESRVAFNDRIRRVLARRRIFLTSRNYLGIAAESTDIGDEVWILPSQATPFVMRPSENDDSLTLIGEAYVDGIMYGEAMKWEGEDSLEWAETEIS